MEEVNKQCHPDALKLLVGTKFDIEQKVVKPTDIIVQRYYIGIYSKASNQDV
jgi:hypothetical protein